MEIAGLDHASQRQRHQKRTWDQVQVFVECLHEGIGRSPNVPAHLAPLPLSDLKLEPSLFLTVADALIPHDLKLDIEMRQTELALHVWRG